jgi:hypothetical protein
MLLILYGAALVIAFVSVAVAAMKDQRLAKAGGNPKSKQEFLDGTDD